MSAVGRIDIAKTALVWLPKAIRHSTHHEATSWVISFLLSVPAVPGDCFNFGDVLVLLSYVGDGATDEEQISISRCEED